MSKKVKCKSTKQPRKCSICMKLTINFSKSQLKKGERRKCDGCLSGENVHTPYSEQEYKNFFEVGNLRVKMYKEIEQGIHLYDKARAEMPRDNPPGPTKWLNNPEEMVKSWESFLSRLGDDPLDKIMRNNSFSKWMTFMMNVVKKYKVVFDPTSVSCRDNNINIAKCVRIDHSFHFEQETRSIPIENVIRPPITEFVPDLANLRLVILEEGKNDSQTITYLMMDPETGFAPRKWQGNIGKCLLFNCDGSDLLQSTVEKLHDFLCRCMDIYSDGRKPDFAKVWNDEDSEDDFDEGEGEVSSDLDDDNERQFSHVPRKYHTSLHEVFLKHPTIIFKRNKKLNKLYHLDTGLVIKSAREKVVIGRIENDELIPLDEIAVNLCEEWGFKYELLFDKSDSDLDNNSKEKNLPGRPMILGQDWPRIPDTGNGLLFPPDFDPKTSQLPQLPCFDSDYEDYDYSYSDISVDSEQISERKVKKVTPVAETHDSVKKHKCCARTQKGVLCTRPVKQNGEKCYQHKKKPKTYDQKIEEDTQTQPYHYDDETKETFHQSMRHMMESMIPKDGIKRCVICRDTQDQTPLVFIKSLGKILCTECRDIQLAM